MKINYKKFILTIITLIVSFASSAQLPDPDNSGGGGGDPPAPIDGMLVWLTIVGLAFAFYQFNLNRKKA